MPSFAVVKNGPRFTIAAQGDDLSCSVKDFLEDLRKNHAKTHAKLDRILDRTVQMGPPVNNKAQCKMFKGEHAEGLFEFIVDDVRLLCFYAKERAVIICSHGFFKDGQDTPRGEIDRAQALRKRCV